MTTRTGVATKINEVNVWEGWWRKLPILASAVWHGKVWRRS